MSFPSPPALLLLPRPVFWNKPPVPVSERRLCFRGNENNHVPRWQTGRAVSEPPCPVGGLVGKGCPVRVSAGDLGARSRAVPGPAPPCRVTDLPFRPCHWRLWGTQHTLSWELTERCHACRACTGTRGQPALPRPGLQLLEVGLTVADSEHP